MPINDNLTLEELNELHKDRFLNAQFSLWNTIITLNALLIGFISILYSLNPSLNYVFTIIIFSLSILSIILLTINFVLTRNFYAELGKMDINTIKNYTKEEEKLYNEEQNRKFRKQHYWVTFREYTSFISTGLNLIFVFIIISIEESVTKDLSIIFKLIF